MDNIDDVMERIFVQAKAERMQTKWRATAAVLIKTILPDFLSDNGKIADLDPVTQMDKIQLVSLRKQHEAFNDVALMGYSMLLRLCEEGLICEHERDAYIEQMVRLDLMRQFAIAIEMSTDIPRAELAVALRKSILEACEHAIKKEETYKGIEDKVTQSLAMAESFHHEKH